MNAVLKENTKLFYNRMDTIGALPHLALSDPSGHIRLAHSDFLPFEGTFNAEPFLTINMATKYIGRIKRVSEQHHLEGVLRPGTIGITLPNSKASGFWTKTQILAIAVDLKGLASTNDRFSVNLETLSASASTLHNDPLLTSVMTAMWRDAQENGLSSAFFKQGLLLILKRLSEYQLSNESKRISRSLNGERLKTVLDLIERRISTTLSIDELAASVCQDKSSFSRSFRDATGYAPYEYFTIRRMERAKHFLTNSHSVTEVALNLGYNNPSKFSATFKKIHGLTPSDWRRSQNSIN